MFAPPFRVPVLGAPLALAACLMPVPLADAEAGRLARTIAEDSARFHTALAAMAAPECSYEQTKNYYDSLQHSAQALRGRFAERGASAPVMRAADALVSLSGDMRASHQAASARVDDPRGPCMAPEAISLNAAALDRASKAIAAATMPKGAE